MAEQLGDAVLDLRADGKQLQKDVDQARSSAVKSLKSAGQQMSKTGMAMTKSVTLPIVGAGAAIVGMGAKFETQLSRITGLVGISKEETDKLGQSVLDLAPKVGKGPDELADALFTVTSAGFRGSEAMDVLEQAAKASAAGLGETRDIAEAATGVINTYGSEVITAAEATDIVTATARAGNFATEQLAGSLGRVTPFAEAAGASFADVGGAIALLTRRNNDAAMSIDQTAALMRAFSAPTKQTQDALDALGLSTEQVRQMMSEKGLAGTLQELDKRLEGNRDMLREIIPDSSGFSAALSILNADADELNDTFGMTNDAVGLTDEAFDAASDTAKFKFDQAMADAKKTLIEVSGDVLPSVVDVGEDLIGMLKTAADWWNRQDESTRKNIIRFAALVAALGPVLWIGGKLVSLVGTVITVVKALSTAMLFLAANPIVLVIAAVAALVAGLVIAYQKSETFRRIVDTAFGAVVDAGKKMASVVVGAARFMADMFLAHAENIVGAAAKAFGWVPGVGDKLKDAHRAIKEFRAKSNEELDRLQTRITYGADVSQATAAIRQLRREMAAVPKASTVQFGGTRGGITAHSGLRVPGPRHMEVPVTALGGERILSHAETDALDRGELGGGGVGPTTLVAKDGPGGRGLARTFVGLVRDGLIELENEQR